MRCAATCRLLGLLTLALCTAAGAQKAVFKTVGPDGKITYTDREPGASQPGQNAELRLAAVQRNPAAAVFNPTFTTARGEIRAGKAFFAQLPACPGVTLVSALHLFGPAGGIGVQLRPEEIGGTVRRIVLSNIGSGAGEEFAAVSRTPPGATPCCQGDAVASGVGDVAAFSAPARRDIALPVSGTPVKRGDKVYVITSIAGVAKGERTRFEAVARGMERGYLAYDILDAGYAVRATSGAPVLNAAGEVVAINLGGGSADGSGRMYGIGNPATAWRDALAASCKP